MAPRFGATVGSRRYEGLIRLYTSDPKMHAQTDGGFRPTWHQVTQEDGPRQSRQIDRRFASRQGRRTVRRRF